MRKCVASVRAFIVPNDVFAQLFHAFEKLGLGGPSLAAGRRKSGQMMRGRGLTHRSALIC